MEADARRRPAAQIQHMPATQSGGMCGELRPEPQAPDITALRPLLTPVKLAAGDDLGAVTDSEPYVYFIETGLVSVSAPLAGGQAPGVQLAAAGDAVGLESVFLLEAISTIPIVLVPGLARRCAVTRLRRRCDMEPSLALRLASRLTRQTRSLQAEVACCVQHSVEQRLARLLMGMSEKLNTTVLPVTQEQLASVLGVQRTTITALAGRLKAAGALAYMRGKVSITNRERLAKAGCGCAI